LNRVRAKTLAEIPPFASFCATFIIAGSPFRPPCLRFDNFARIVVKHR
jgi:hypothetical protein